MGKEDYSKISIIQGHKGMTKLLELSQRSKYPNGHEKILPCTFRDQRMVNTYREKNDVINFLLVMFKCSDTERKPAI